MENAIVDIQDVITSLRSIFKKENQYQMRRKNGLRNTDQISFLGIPKSKRLCDKCNTPFEEGALDFLSDEFVCPHCENGKDEE